MRPRERLRRYQYSWYEMYPDALVYLGATAVAGDNLVSRVCATSSGALALSLVGSGRGWSHPINQTNYSPARRRSR